MIYGAHIICDKMVAELLDVYQEVGVEEKNITSPTLYLVVAE
jgi:hypothetical protein